MKKLLAFCLVVSGIWFAGCANTQSSGNWDEQENREEQVSNSKLNNRRLEKNLDKFAEELNLSKKQQKQLKKIDKRYARMERKLGRRDDTKRRDRKRLADEKRQEIIEVLNPEQQQKLEALSKKGRFSLEQLFGK